jgi:hypothetical protein
MTKEEETGIVTKAIGTGIRDEGEISKVLFLAGGCFYAYFFSTSGDLICFLKHFLTVW